MSGKRRTVGHRGRYRVIWVGEDAYTLEAQSMGCISHEVIGVFKDRISALAALSAVNHRPAGGAGGGGRRHA